jgi:hypothetical protein
MINRKNVIIICLFLLTFALGTIGYYMETGSVLDSMYDTVSLYGFQTAIDDKNMLIEIDRWLAPTLLAGSVFVAVNAALQWVKDVIRGFRSDAIAIYYDGDKKDRLRELFESGIVSGEKLISSVKRHIIMFKDDSTNLEFYTRHKAVFERGSVYIKLEDTDPLLLSKERYSNINIFNPNEIIARNYWHNHSFRNSEDYNIKVAVVGFGSLGRELLKSALMSNLYSLTQSIEYHIWGDTNMYEQVHSDFETMNGDKLFYHGDDYDISELKNMDRVIVTLYDKTVLEMLLNVYHGDIDCYCAENSLIEDIYANKRLSFFGKNVELYTPDNIIAQKNNDVAKALNYAFVNKYPPKDRAVGTIDEEWRRLSGFTKGSNTSATDYYGIWSGLNIDDEELSQLEHIRWCRYHLYNHWSYSEVRNDEERKHPCLVEFNRLSDKDKLKDKETLDTIRSLFE